MKNRPIDLTGRLIPRLLLQNYASEIAIFTDGPIELVR